MKSTKIKRKILVVEDDVHIRNNIVEFLTLHDYEVSFASNGFEGLHQYAIEKPDLIICDIMMPEMDGYTFLEEVQKKYPLNFTIFIFLTAKSSQADLRKGMNLGADDYIIKPFSFDDLIVAIEKKFEKSDLRKASIDEAVSKVSKQILETPYHEFNTCLSGILTGSQLMLGSSEKLQLDLETKSILDVIQRSGLRLSRAINNFILNNEFSTKSYHPFVEDVPASFIVNTIVNIAGNYNRSKDLVLSVEGSSIRTDKFLLKRALEELCENAFKFSQIGDLVIWDIFLLARGAKLDLEYPNRFRFNKEKFDLASPYNQFVDGNKTIDGLGLGLYLTKKIMEILDGEISYTSTDKSANKFHVSFRYMNEE